LVYFLQQGQLNILETFISHYIISSHLVGGLLMSVGLLTRVGALIQLPIVSGALIIVHSKEALFSINQNIELTALVLFLLGIYAIIGSGNLSIDHHIVEDDPERNVWIEEFIKKIFSTDGALTLVRLSSKIRKKPDMKSTIAFNQSAFEHHSKLRNKKSFKKK